MGLVMPPPPFRPNLDKRGEPRDYETYVWATYGAGKDISLERRRFLYPARDGAFEHPDLGQSVIGFSQQTAWR